MDSRYDSALREQLRQVLTGEQSHLTFQSAVADFPVEKAGTKPESAPHTAWELLEHLRIAQKDVLEFSRNPKHKSPKWPDGYWPDSVSPPDAKSWTASIAEYHEDLAAMESLIVDATQDLFAPIEGGDGQTLLREALVLATHNSYHLGQLVYLKKMLS